MKGPEKVRLDTLLVARGLAPGLGKAQALVLAGRVRVDGQPADKVGTRYPEDIDVRLVGGGDGWASRGARKLLGALDAFPDVAARIGGAPCLDVGASTGGFTDVLLRQGASQVIALDVGYGLLDWRLQSDARVTVMDRTNIRTLVPGALPFTPSVITCDASFIRVQSFLNVFHRELAPGGVVITLVKPQFELPKDEVPDGGVVVDEEQRQQALALVRDAAVALGFQVLGSCDSPLAGPKGNRELLLVLQK